MTSTILLFIVALAGMWLASGLVVRGVERVADALRISQFTIAFLLLGLLTSISEMSVGANAVAQGTPGVFVGNLIGGSFVLLTLIIPFLAVTHRGLNLAEHLDGRKLWLFLVLLFAPSLVALDGNVGRAEAVLLILLYSAFVVVFYRRAGFLNHLRINRPDRRVMTLAVGEVLVGAAIIAVTGHVLVDETVAFAGFLGVPALLVSLFLLSIGTNLPEFTLAIRSLVTKRTDIAFGDYIGSAAANSLLFGIFTLISGPFHLDTAGVNLPLLTIALGYILYYLFARSGRRVSTSEGIGLIAIFALFLVIQMIEILIVSPIL
ncbi:MAG: sodium:calcium antiporter [Candidatus Kerfeldbacteria bacterium]|nr:sodium:calcium antiporter [Candidatus Kerfeldbacteria bacterium]